ncbi:hypothetical protein EG68_07893 [Paragonimus skrjabini miyazakii]|uniref:Uncharacterized protein n=1 Tax=Paragonimus skrjabini miyazakii TaxID=59628 RepID=A0A8S9YUE0_9TREM|nr:hypothetical protein EG68_07893 [Paragonimus skrjabini miyazakii]
MKLLPSSVVPQMLDGYYHFELTVTWSTFISSVPPNDRFKPKSPQEHTEDEFTGNPEIKFRVGLPNASNKRKLCDVISGTRFEMHSASECTRLSNFFIYLIWFLPAPPQYLRL